MNDQILRAMEREWRSSGEAFSGRRLWAERERAGVCSPWQQDLQKQLRHPWELEGSWSQRFVKQGRGWPKAFRKQGAGNVRGRMPWGARRLTRELRGALRWTEQSLGFGREFGLRLAAFAAELTLPVWQSAIYEALERRYAEVVGPEGTCARCERDPDQARDSGRESDCNCDCDRNYESHFESRYEFWEEGDEEVPRELCEDDEHASGSFDPAWSNRGASGAGPRMADVEEDELASSEEFSPDARRLAKRPKSSELELRRSRQLDEQEAHRVFGVLGDHVAEQGWQVVSMAPLAPLDREPSELVDSCPEDKLSALREWLADPGARNEARLRALAGEAWESLEPFDDVATLGPVGASAWLASECSLHAALAESDELRDYRVLQTILFAMRACAATKGDGLELFWDQIWTKLVDWALAGADPRRSCFEAPRAQAGCLSRKGVFGLMKAGPRLAQAAELDC